MVGVFCFRSHLGSRIRLRQYRRYELGSGVAHHTPVAIAQEALRDAVRSRDRECAGGVGCYCREREQSVVERQRALDAAVSSVEERRSATEAASKIVAWLSGGNANPTAADFAMLRSSLLHCFRRPAASS